MHINLEICLSQQYEMDRYDINMSDNDEQAILLIVCNQIALSNTIVRCFNQTILCIPLTKI